MDKTEVKTEVKENRYTILDAEIKRLSKALKIKKQEMLKAIKDAEAEYRKYRNEIYKPSRLAAFDRFKAAKIVGTKPKAEKPAKKAAKKVVVKAAAPTEPAVKPTADEVIAKGEASIAKFKAKAEAKIAACKNPKAK